MILKFITLMVVSIVVLGPLLLWQWRQSITRERFAETIKTMAERGRDEISGHTVEYWLNIINSDTTQPIVVTETMVLRYKGREFFFVDGGISYTYAGKNHPAYGLEKGFFLVVVDKSAVNLLFEQGRVFRRIAGTADLAAYSIFRWSDFAKTMTRG